MSPTQGRRDLDEDDVRIRPGKGTRPRTRTRPAHTDAVPARVLVVDRGRFTCLLASDTGERVVTAMKARELGRKGVVVGDEVELVGDTRGEPGSLARIVRVRPRRSVLRRTADDDDPVERVIVANADQLVIVVALADPPPRPRLIDRALVAAFDAGLDPLLCLTKADLAPPETLVNTYRAIGVPWVVTQRGAPVEHVRERLRGKVSVLLGHSGVGKSTLVNALVPGADRATGVVNEVTGRGRHVSSSAISLRLPGGDGWVIDTPGVRSLGLAYADPDHVVAAFPDLAPGTANCPPACSHDEPDCALDSWVAAGHADPARLASLRRLLASRAGETD